MINKIILVGIVGKEINYSVANNCAIAEFTLALNNEKIYNKTTQTTETKTLWLKVKFLGNIVENYLKPYLKIGNSVYIEGKLNVVEWQDNFKQGRKSYSILGDKIKILSNFNDNEKSTSNNEVKQETEEKVAPVEKEIVKKVAPVEKEVVKKNKTDEKSVETTPKKTRKFSSSYKTENTEKQEIIVPPTPMIPEESIVSYGYSGEEDDIPF